MPRASVLSRLLSLGAFVLLFIVAIELITGSVAWIGEGYARTLLASTSNPFMGLFVGIMVTVLVQSSSVTTALAVGLVAGGGLSLAGAIPVVIGANVGTSVTNTVVALGSISRPREFRLAVEAATIHDFFNLMVAAVFFPLELAFNLLSAPAAWLTTVTVASGAQAWFTWLTPLTEPLVALFTNATGREGVVLLLFGVVLLLVSLRQIVRFLRGIVLTRTEGVLSNYVFRSAWTALLWGGLLTVLVQSSSVTTSLTVPLVAASVLTVRQTYPFVVGANVGTTITAVLVALIALPSSVEPVLAVAALHLAFVHLCFNLMGLMLLLPIRPLRELPIRAAGRLGKAAEQRRVVVLAYIAIVFIVIPVMAIIFTNTWSFSYTPATPHFGAASDPDTLSLIARTTIGGGAIQGP